MKKKCNHCGIELDIKTGKIDITSYTNPITSQGELSISVHYQTFCRNCGELIYGATRKILTHEQILKLMEDRKYG